MAVVYIHMKPHNREIFYVGIGNNIKRAYITNGRNNLWQKVFKKYGRIVDIIANNISFKEAKELEKFLVKSIGRLNKKEGTLVNLTDGGDGILGKKHSIESKKKMSDSAKGRIVSNETRTKISQSNKGKVISEETRRKISEKNKNYISDKKLEALKITRRIKLENGIRIKELTTGIEFNLVDSKKYFNIPKTTISRNSLIGNPLRSKKFNGLNFTRIKGQKKNDKIVLNILLTTKRTAPTNNKLILDTENGIFWNSIFEVSTIYGIGYSTLQRKLRGEKINDTNLIIV